MKPIYEPDGNSNQGKPGRQASAARDRAGSPTHKSIFSNWWVIVVLLVVAVAGFGSSAGWFPFGSSRSPNESETLSSAVGDGSSVVNGAGIGDAATPADTSAANATTKPLQLSPLMPKDVPALIAECQSVLEHLATRFPGALETKELRARFEYEFGDTDRARQLWTEVIQLNPNYVYALRGLGDVATIDGDLDTAVRYFRRAVLADPGNLSRQLTLGIALLHAAHLEEAKSVLTAVLEQDPELVDAHVELAGVLTQLDEFEAARDHLATALEATPDKAEIHFQLASVYRRLKEIDKAKHHIEKHQELQQSVRTDREQGRRNYDDVEAMMIDIARLYVDVARVYLAGSSQQDAELLLVRANRMDPTNLDAPQALAYLAAQSGELYDAIRWMKAVTALRPDQFAYAEEVSKLYLRAGQSDEAEHYLTTFVYEHPENLTALRSAARFFLEAKPDFEQATRFGKAAAELAPTPENYALLATIYDAAGQINAAIDALETALKLDPNNASYRQALAIIREQQIVEGTGP